MPRTGWLNKPVQQIYPSKNQSNEVSNLPSAYAILANELKGCKVPLRQILAMHTVPSIPNDEEMKNNQIALPTYLPFPELLLQNINSDKEELIERLKLTPPDIEEVEIATRGQRSNTLWFLLKYKTKSYQVSFIITCVS